MKKKKDERELIGHCIFESLDKLHHQGIEPGYGAYVMFCTLGSLILKHDGLTHYYEYLQEIKEKNADYFENTPGPSAAH